MNVKEIAKLLNFARKLKGLTQAEVAQSIQIYSRSHLSDIYAGKRGLTLSMLKKIADVHSIKCWELVYFSELSDFNTKEVQETVSPSFFALMSLYYQQEDSE